MEFLDRVRLAGRILVNGTSAGGGGRRQQREIPAITPDEVVEAKAFFPLDKFFIFGHARSGTTLLARLIRLHPQVHCNWQAHFFTRPPLLLSLVDREEVSAWLARRSNRWNRGRDLSPVILRAVADFVLEREARREGKTIVGDKSPNSLLDGEAVRLTHAVYPDARLIFIIRDGRDTVLSHRLQSFIDGTQHLSKGDLQIRADFMQHPEHFQGGRRSLFRAKGLQRAAQGWVHNLSETDRAGRELFHDRYTFLRYEDLLADPWSQLEQLWAFLGATRPVAGLRETVIQEMEQNPDADWQQHKAGELVQTVKKGQQGNWRELFTPHDKQVFQEVAGATLAAWGYDGQD
ncbi:MAG TPA: sulfotransferase [Anaerolineales bacterium]|nr:sulfotransferase [Anaerolineales bacterium]